MNADRVPNKARASIPVTLAALAVIAAALTVPRMRASATTIDGGEPTFWNVTATTLHLPSGAQLRITSASLDEARQRLPAGVSGVIVDKRSLPQLAGEITGWYRNGLVIVGLDLDKNDLLRAVMSHPGAFSQIEQQSIPDATLHPGRDGSWSGEFFSVIYRTLDTLLNGVVLGEASHEYSPQAFTRMLRAR